MIRCLLKGQSIIEYSTLLVLLILGIIVAGPYAVRAINAHLKGWEDSVHDSFNDPLTPASPADMKNIHTCDGPPKSSCESPYETPQNCCWDCGYCGDGVCCKDADGKPTAGDEANGCTDCVICGDGICSSDESCCLDPNCGCDPNDNVCCRDANDNPSGCDVGSPACAIPGFCEDATPQCEPDPPKKENIDSCCEQCAVRGDGDCSRCEQVDDPTGRNFSPEDCCDDFCHPPQGSCANSGCKTNCSHLCIGCCDPGKSYPCRMYDSNPTLCEAINGCVYIEGQCIGDNFGTGQTLFNCAEQNKTVCDQLSAPPTNPLSCMSGWQCAISCTGLSESACCSTPGCYWETQYKDSSGICSLLGAGCLSTSLRPGTCFNLNHPGNSCYCDVNVGCSTWPP